jgi:hypothetical protein
VRTQMIREAVARRFFVDVTVSEAEVRAAAYYVPAARSARE